MNRRRWSSLFALVGGLAVSSVPLGARAQVLAHPPTVDTLPNGLRVVTLPFDAPGIVAYFTLVRTGSRDEVERGHSGFAHLFEHMMFRGTQRYSAQEYEHRMQVLGADNNAFTTEDFTLYTVTIPTASLAALVPIEADRFRSLSYSEQAFQTETRAVLGEYNKNAASPVHQMWETLSEAAFTRHTYGHTTMGYLRDIAAMPSMYAYSQDFFRRFYTPDNCTVVVAGDVARDQVLALVTEHYGAWTGRRATPAVPPEPAQTAPRRRDLVWEGTSPPRVLIGYRVPAFALSNRDAVALDVVHALAFSESSPLYQRMVVRESKLLALESWGDERHRDPGLFVVQADLAGATGFDEVERGVTETLAQLASTPVEADRLAEMISHLRYAMPMEAQTPAAAATLLARFMALTGEPDTYERYNQALATVTAGDVQRVVRSYLSVPRRTLVTLTPASEAARAPRGAVRVGPNRTAAPARRTP